MKFTKLIASLAAITTVVTSFAPVFTLTVRADSEENMAAYEWAFDEGMTTMSTFAAFNFEGNVTREAAAKFLSKGADALGFDLSSDQECDFADMDSADQSLVNAIQTACEMGIFKAQENFNPKQVLTRAQAELTVARIVYGMDEVNMYGEDNSVTEYEAAREMLMDDGIINVEVPAQSAVKRGHLLLMLYRLADMDMDDDTPIVIDTGSNNTGTVVEVKNGSLELSLGAGTPSNGSSIPSVATVNFATVNFAASSSDVTVRSVTLKREGLGQVSGISRIYFERNGVRVSGRASLTSDGSAIVSFSPALVVKANSSEMLDLVASVADTAGAEHMFRFTSVDSSAQSYVANISTPTLRTTTYTVGMAEFTPLNVSSTQTVRAGEVDTELGQFRLFNTSADSKSVRIKSITFRQNGSADLVNVPNIAIYRDGQKVSSDAVINGREITFPINTTLTDSQSAIFYIKGTIDYVDIANETYKFTLRNVEDFNASETTTNFRISLKGANNVSFSSTDLGTYAALGSDVMLTRDVSVTTNVQVSPGANDVLLMKGNIKANQSITLEDLALRITPTGATLKDMVTTFKVRIGGSVSTWTPLTGAGAQTGEFDGTFSINGTVPFEIRADIKSTATGGTFQFEDVNLNTAGQRQLVEYTNQNPVNAASIAGTIAGSLVTINPSRLNVARTDGLSNRYVVAGSNNVVLGKARFTTADAGYVRLTSVTLSGINTMTGNVTVSLYVNGTVVGGSVNAVTNTVSFSSIPTNLGTVTTANPVTIEFRGNITQSAVGTMPLSLVSVQATDNNGQIVTASPSTVGFATITASAGGTVSFSSNANTPGASLLNAGAMGVELARFNINATDDNLRLTDLYVSTTGASTVNLSNRLSDIQLMDGTTVLANGIVVNGGATIAFEGMNSLGIITTAGNSKTLSIKANVNSVLNSGDVAGGAGLVSLAIGTGTYTAPTAGTVNGARFVSESNGSVVTPSANSMIAISNTHRIVRGKILATASTIPGTDTRIMQFDIAANGNRVNFTELEGVIRNQHTATATINVYKGTSATPGNLIGTTNVVGMAGANTQGYSISVTPQEITTTATYIVEIVNYVPSQVGSNNLSRSFQIDNIIYEDIFNDDVVSVTDASEYVNAGNFPLNAISFNPSN